MFPVNFPVFFSFGELGTLAENKLFSGEVPFPKSMILTGRSIFRRISVPKVSDFWEARPFSGEFPFEESVFSGRLQFFFRRVSGKLAGKKCNLPTNRGLVKGNSPENGQASKNH